MIPDSYLFVILKDTVLLVSGNVWGKLFLRYHTNETSEIIMYKIVSYKTPLLINLWLQIEVWLKSHVTY